MEALQEDAPNDRAFPTTGRLSPEEERQVAEWGEEWVFRTLCRKYRGQPHVRVQWLNQQNEQFDFYDIAEFYEVKSTVTTDKRLLEASKLKDRFNIVRVFGAGNSSSARMLLVDNPSEKCRRKAATGSWAKPSRRHRTSVETALVRPVPAVPPGCCQCPNLFGQSNREASRGIELLLKLPQ
eukprot:s1091_g6.t1